MRVLMIGGTGFIGSRVLRKLLDQGHLVAVFHRGQTNKDWPADVIRIIGERQHLADYTSEFDQFAPQIVLDMISYTEGDAYSLLEVFLGRDVRIVTVSSQDVYRAYGLFLRLEGGELEPTPYDEGAPLRTKLYPYRKIAHGVDDLAQHYDKVLVEGMATSEPLLPFTILRLPKVYGPGDRHRLIDYLKRMDDGRPAILLGEQKSQWRWTRGYVENIASAIALAVTDMRAANRIYNLGEEEALTEAEWARSIGEAAGWSGEIIAVPQDLLPQSMIEPYRWEQNLFADTRRIREHLDYQEEVGRQEALEVTIAWERANTPGEFDVTRFDYATEDITLKRLAR